MTTAANYDSHRVYHLSESLRKQIKASRLESERTVQAFFADSIEEQLPAITEALLAQGLRPTHRNGPVKVAMETRTLKDLHSASAKTGVPQVQLVAACMSLASAGATPKATPKAKPKPRKKATSRKPAAKRATRKRATTKK